MCVGCRRREVQAALLRVVAVAPPSGTAFWRVEPDPRRRAQGRGAYVHPDLGCVRSADRRRAFQRALRLGSPPDIGPLRSWLEQQAGVTRPTGVDGIPGRTMRSGRHTGGA
ncbi:MAG: YlxR family protein [Ornithinimicrobium sp.]|uniref:YlxR family protein n=1 Tax=Ornithinimicrobium sp. TaxID=1977084 RepID=UPI003D9B47C0